MNALRLNIYIYFYTLLITIIIARKYIIVNNKTTENRDIVHIHENSTMILECVTTAQNISNRLSLKFYEKVISLYNQTRLVYHIQEIQCLDGGLYICRERFANNQLAPDNSVYINVQPCLVPLMVTANNETLLSGSRLFINEGSSLALKCSTPRSKIKFKLSISKSEDPILEERTHELEYVFEEISCKDSGVYACLYRDDYGLTRREATFIINVNCTLYIKRVSIFDKDDWPSDVLKKNGSVLKLICVAETFSFPTNLTVTWEEKQPQVWRENETSVTLFKERIDCQDIGQYTCELEDILRQTIYRKSVYIWVKECPATLCHQEIIAQIIYVIPQNNVSLEICLKMLNSIQIATVIINKESETVLVEDKSKYRYNLKVIQPSLVHVMFKFEVFNVSVKDFGHYVIRLRFDNGQSFCYNFSIITNVSADDTTTVDKDGFLHIGLPIIVITILTFFASLVCRFTLKKEIVTEHHTQVNEASPKQESNEYQTINELKDDNEDDECYEKIVDDECITANVQTELNLTTQSIRRILPPRPTTSTDTDLIRTPQELFDLTSHDVHYSEVNSLTRLEPLRGSIEAVSGDDKIISHLENNRSNHAELSVANFEMLEHYSSRGHSNNEAKKDHCLISDLNKSKETLIKKDLGESCFTISQDEKNLHNDRIKSFVENIIYSQAGEIYKDHQYLTLNMVTNSDCQCNERPTETSRKFSSSDNISSLLDHGTVLNDYITPKDPYVYEDCQYKPLDPVIRVDDYITPTDPFIYVDGRRKPLDPGIGVDDYITTTDPFVDVDDHCQPLDTGFEDDDYSTPKDRYV